MLSLFSPLASFREPLSSSSSSSLRRSSLLLFTPRRTQRVSAVSTAETARTMYELLAVPETAGPAEIKTAYRRQARRWHPDSCRSTGEKPFFAQQFMRAREAYEILSDPILRRDYDLALRAGCARVRAGGGREGFGDWEAQLEGLQRRAARPGRENSWGSRMRSGGAHRSAAD